MNTKTIAIQALMNWESAIAAEDYGTRDEEEHARKVREAINSLLDMLEVTL